MAADPAAARLNMVESQVRVADVTDVRIHDAMREVRREDLIPPERAWLAYADTEVAYAPGRSLMKPRDVAKLLQALRPMPGERVLALAAPYAGAVIEAMGIAVTQQDTDIATPLDQGFDLIVCEGAVDRAPDAWLAALSPGGRLGVVERSGPVGKACVYLRAGEGVGRREVFDATAPLMADFSPQAGFVL